MNEADLERFSKLGFSHERGGAHTSRTMMLEELRALLSYVGRPDAIKSDYLRAIDEENCLGKRSGKTRVLTYRHLVDLYALDPSVIIFRAMLFFWGRDLDARPLLALLCTYARDPIFRMSVPFLLSFEEGASVTRVVLERVLDEKTSGRFSPATLKSTAQNINSTWTKSGHLVGKAAKTRTKPVPTAGSVSYALFLGSLTGVRGQELFRTEYMKLLDCSFERAIELAVEASRKGWIIFKRIGDVVEVGFPNLI